MLVKILTLSILVYNSLFFNKIILFIKFVYILVFSVILSNLPRLLLLQKEFY